jgi:hypothetical protein
MHDDFYYDWTARTREILREVAAELSDPDEGTTLAPMREEFIGRVRALIDAGDLKIPVDTAILAAFREADEHDGKSADKTMARRLRGEDSLDMDDDPGLAIVVTLGGGRRKPLAQINADDLREMDTLRYSNLRNAQNAYDVWRTDTYDPGLAALSSGCTWAEAEARGHMGGRL